MVRVKVRGVNPEGRKRVYDGKDVWNREILSQKRKSEGVIYDETDDLPETNPWDFVKEHMPFRSPDQLHRNTEGHMHISWFSFLPVFCSVCFLFRGAFRVAHFRNPVYRHCVAEYIFLHSFVRLFVTAGRSPAYSGSQCWGLLYASPMR